MTPSIKIEVTLNHATITIENDVIEVAKSIMHITLIKRHVRALLQSNTNISPRQKNAIAFYVFCCFDCELEGTVEKC